MELHVIKISDVEKRLEKFREEFGDLEVWSLQEDSIQGSPLYFEYIDSQVILEEEDGKDELGKILHVKITAEIQR